MTGASWATLAGFLLLFLGERTFGTNEAFRLTLWVVGLGLLGLGFVLRARAMGAAGADGTRRALKTALQFQVLAAVGLLFYVLGSSGVVEALGLGQEGALRWEVATTVLWILAVTLGLVTMSVVDRAVASSPVDTHPLRLREARTMALTAVLGLAILFPLNWLAQEFNHRWDVSYFRTTEPGTAVAALVENLDEPVRAILFFPSSNDVAEELRPYFDRLAGPTLSVEVLDHAMEPTLARDLKVRENGSVALIKGEQTEIIKIGTDLDKAKRTLKALDEKVQQSLLALAKGERVAWFTVGHDEYGWRGQDDQSSRVTLLKKLLEAMNFKVKTLGMAEGLANEVPDDASVVFIMGPASSFLPQEIDALNRYRERGGRLFVALEPTLDPDVDFSGLLDPLGLTFEPWTLVTDDKKTYLPMTGGLADRQNLGTNRYTSHDSVTTLSRNRSRAWMIFPGAGALVEKDSHGGKLTTTVRTHAQVWADLDGDFEFDADTESRKVRDLAAVATGPAQDGGEYRAVVVADAGFAADHLLANRANTQFVLDATNWLLGEEDLAGTVNKEEDVKIVHSKEGQGAWFYGSTFLVPLGIGLLGFMRVRRRRMSRSDA